MSIFTPERVAPYELAVAAMWGEPQTVGEFIGHLASELPTVVMCYAGQDRSYRMAKYMIENGYPLHPRHTFINREGESVTTGLSLGLAASLTPDAQQVVILLDMKDPNQLDLYLKHVAYLTAPNTLGRIWVVDGSEEQVAEWLGSASTDQASRIRIGAVPGMISLN